MRKRKEFDYRKLKGRIVEKYGTQRKFAESNHISERTMSLKLNNEVRLSQEEILEWCEKLAIEPKDVHIYFFTPKVSKMKLESER